MIENLYGYNNLNQSQKTGKGGFCRRKGANIAKNFLMINEEIFQNSKNKCVGFDIFSPLRRKPNY